MPVPEKPPIVLCAVLVACATVAVILVLLPHRDKARATSEAEPTVWPLPSCPRELTLQDGTRWSPPKWSEPGCKAVIGWQIVKEKAGTGAELAPK